MHCNHILKDSKRRNHSSCAMTIAHPRIRGTLACHTPCPLGFAGPIGFGVAPFPGDRKLSVTEEMSPSRPSNRSALTPRFSVSCTDACVSEASIIGIRRSDPLLPSLEDVAGREKALAEAFVAPERVAGRADSNHLAPCIALNKGA